MKIRAPVVLLAAGFALLGVALSCKQPSGPPPDTASPTVSVSSSTSDPTGEPLIALLIVFSEVVSGFEVTDLTLMNATSGNFATADYETFTVDLTPLAEGLVTLNIAASVCTDAAGNPNAVLTSAFSRTYTQKPFAIISSATAAATNTSPIPITIIFNKAVDNFEQADVTGTNCAISNFINTVANHEWTADLTPAGQGTVEAAVPANVCFQQGTLVPNAASAAFSRTYDITAPGASLSSSEPEPTNTSIQITITFSEPIASGTFTAGDIAVSGGGSAANLQTSNDTIFTADVAAGGQGSVTISLPAAACKDLAGNDNTAAPASVTRTYDSVKPSVALSSSEPEPTNTSIQITITFSEPIANSTFTAGDITVSGGGSAGNLQTSDSTEFTADVTPGVQGTTTISLGADVCTDPAGNTNTAAPSSITRTYDGRPFPVITSTTQNRTNSSPIPITITFDEAVTGFDASDLAVSNGTKGAWTGVDGDTVYTCDITPIAAGTITVDIAAGVCLDQDGTADPNTAATQFTRTYITTLGFQLEGWSLSIVNPSWIGGFKISANPNRVLIVSVCAQATGTAPSISSVTYGANAMTLVPGSLITADNGGAPAAFLTAALFYLKNPPAEEELYVYATLGAPAERVILGAVSLYDAYVHGVDPIGSVAVTNAGASNTVTTNISTTSAFSSLVDMMASEGPWGPSLSVAAGQTMQWSAGSTEGCTSGGSTKPVASAGPTSMTWTLGSAQSYALLNSVVEIKIAR